MSNERFKRGQRVRMKPRYEGDTGATARIIRADRPNLRSVLGGAGWWVIRFEDSDGNMLCHQDDIAEVIA